jgi:hypothetical protein
VPASHTQSTHVLSHPLNDLNFFDSPQCLMVRRWRLIGHFPILYNPLQRHHKRCKQKIEKDELRVGREIDNGDYLMTLWHHLGCWGDMDKGFGSDDMEVFEGLDASDQDEVRQALDEPVKKVKKGTCPFLHCPLPCGAGWRPRLSSLNPTRPSTQFRPSSRSAAKKTTPKANKETKKPAPLPKHPNPNPRRINGDSAAETGRIAHRGAQVV